MQGPMSRVHGTLRQTIDLVYARFGGDEQEPKLVSERIEAGEIARLAIHIHLCIQR